MKTLEDIKRDGWESGINKVWHGDCLEMMKLLPDKSVDLVLTSPPYDNLRDYNGFTFDFEGIAKELYRVVKEGGVVVWVVGDSTTDGSESYSSFKQAIYFNSIGFKLHDTMIYKKDSIAFPNPRRYHQCFEYMFVFSKLIPKTVNLIQDKINSTGNDGRKGRRERQKDGKIKLREKDVYKIKEIGTRWNIWEYGVGYMKTTTDIGAYKHPAMFPEKLAADHIKSWSNGRDLVLDPMCGSGTTCKMAKQLNRNFIGIEISEKYCKIAEDRLRQSILL